VGQRSGLGLAPDRPDAVPLHVIAVDAATNTVTVGPRQALERSVVELGDVHWIGVAPVVGASLSVQLRAHALPAPVILATVADTVRLQCDALISQVAPGQAGVLYHGDEVVGGGVVLAP
jgi:tRNA-specific 2-thiouridylase